MSELRELQIVLQESSEDDKKEQISTYMDRIEGEKDSIKFNLNLIKEDKDELDKLLAEFKHVSSKDYRGNPENQKKRLDKLKKSIDWKKERLAKHVEAIKGHEERIDGYNEKIKKLQGKGGILNKLKGLFNKNKNKSVSAVPDDVKQAVKGVKLEKPKPYIDFSSDHYIKTGKP